MPHKPRTGQEAARPRPATPLAAASVSAYILPPPMPSLSLHSPLGPLTLSQEDDAIVSLDWGWGRDQTRTKLLARGVAQLHAYFDRALHDFDLPLAPQGSVYRLRVWGALRAIPYGQTCSYAALARTAGGSARSVGGANGANPIPIIIPCHRVVGSAGPGGYSGGEGLVTKSWLLALEGAVSPTRPVRAPLCDLMDTA